MYDDHIAELVIALTLIMYLVATLAHLDCNDLSRHGAGLKLTSFDALVDC